MTKVEVFRVENSDNVGMYSADASKDMFDLQGRHPTPGDDIKLGPVWEKMEVGRKDRMRFAFSSIEQLKCWIYSKPLRESLTDEEFSINVYSVSEEHTHIGETQCVFIPSEATKLYKLSLLEI